MENSSLEKAIEIKRRAQRCIQNGDLDGALSEYEKLVADADADPYNFVLLADLLYKKGDHAGASQRYLAAATAYEKASLFKNGIAVCKKMMRLSLSPTVVLQRLALLHGLDGLATEAALYYMQHAELALREDRAAEAVVSLQKAFEASPENIKALERLAEVQILRGEPAEAAKSLADAAGHYQQAGLMVDADRCRNRIELLGSGGAGVHRAGAAASPAAAEATSENGAAPASERRVPHREHQVDYGRRVPALEPAPVDESRVDPPPAAEVEPVQVESGMPAGGMSDTDDAPGLQFEAPAVREPARAESRAAQASSGVSAVEALLARAQEQFRAGHRDLASGTLVEAARAYDGLGQHDSAATIYRSLSKSAQTATDVLTLWLRNCETRRDLVEAAQVACELGDRALNEGDMDAAGSWFKRATTLDPANPLAHRRLQRLGAGATAPLPEMPPPPAVEAPSPGTPAAGRVPAPAAGTAPTAAAPAGLEPGRVELAVGRGEAVTFDLGSLVSEFQRGVEAQISGDAQGHYDLGMTYREMGLLEQAVEAFRTASADPEFAQRAAEMIGRCMLDQGQFDDAAQEFSTALESPGRNPAVEPDLRYQLGLAHEAAGRVHEALAEFEKVYAAQANYPDVALKIRVLRKTLESL
jgi:tetratricopeptide (TPR) repeat protein